MVSKGAEKAVKRTFLLANFFLEHPVLLTYCKTNLPGAGGEELGRVEVNNCKRCRGSKLSQEREKELGDVDSLVVVVWLQECAHNTGEA